MISYQGISNIVQHRCKTTTECFKDTYNNSKIFSNVAVKFRKVHHKIFGCTNMCIYNATRAWVGSSNMLYENSSFTNPR